MGIAISTGGLNMEIVTHKNITGYQQTAVAYTRLSVEEAKEGESSSITNQKNIISRYCDDNNIKLLNIFADDGYSGSNFNRPDFKKMIEYLKQVKVDMVITKDLSRLGRDMTESSHYAEIVFPEMNIHYIAISDGFDSQKVNVMAPFQFAMNDVYLRETSRKINQVIQNKRLNGEYCACPAFGYMKENGKTNHLVPNPDTAPTVKYIFKLACEGLSAFAIATRLTDEGYTTPLMYRVQTGNFTEKGAARAVENWNHTTVKRILQNEVYLGHTILGKQKKASLKSKKKISVPKEDWYITRDTHQPLITPEEFETAKINIGKNTKKYTGYDKCRQSIFNGITFCMNCGSAMCSCGSVYNGEREKYWYLGCISNRKRATTRCTHAARIKYTDLLTIIKNELNYFISLSDKEIESIVNSAIKKSNSNQVYEDTGQSKANLTKRINDIDRIIAKLYNDNISGLIDDERLASMVSDLTKESNAIKARLSYEEDTLANNEVKDAYKKFFNIVKQYNHIEDLDEKTVRMFIERIDIGEKILPDGYQVASHHIPTKQQIKITYRFIGCLDDDGQCFNEDNDEIKDDELKKVV